MGVQSSRFQGQEGNSGLGVKSPPNMATETQYKVFKEVSLPKTSSAYRHPLLEQLIEATLK
jgi:hypothetical protein